MADFPPPWDMYASLQSSLRRQHRVGDRSWGTEAGMAHILNVPAGSQPTQHEVDQVVANGRRRERYLDSRRASMPEDVAAPHPEGALHARHALGAIQRNVSDCDWQLLTAAAMGTDYGEIARTTPARPGALRVKVLRLRRELTALIV
jgi:hypothetical protein